VRAAVTPPVVAPAPAIPTHEQRLAEILQLEDARVLRLPDSGATAAEAGPDLVAFLEDARGRVRWRAALAIGRTGMSEGVAPLVATLRDPDPEVRAIAAFALGLLGRPEAAGALGDVLADPDRRVAGRAAEALGLIGARDRAAAIGALVAATAPAAAGLSPDDLSSTLAPEVDAFRLGLYALVRLGAWDEVAAAVLDARGEPRLRWWPVAYALQRLADPRGLRALVTFAQGPGEETVAFGVRGLGVLKDPRGVDALLPLIDAARHGPRVAAAAVRALGQIGDARAVAPISAIAAHPASDRNVRLEAVVALGALRAPAATPVLLDTIGADWPALRGAALGALASIDPEGFIAVLATLDPDPDWRVRADLARALSAMPPDLATPKLQAMQRDGDVRVVAPVLEALAAVNAAGLDDTLRAALTDGDVVVRATAARLVGERAPAGGARWLLDALARSRDDDTYVGRAAMLGAIAKYGAATASGPLRDALADPDWAVRRRAAELLRGLEPAADVSGIRPAPAPGPEAYRSDDLIAPAYSPQAFVETDAGVFQVELAIGDAPLTVRNFIALAGRGFFDGVAIHRVVPNFVVQDGDPRGDGEGGPGYSIRDEINVRPYLRGTVGMALDWADTGGSQWFVTHGPQPHLDGRYTVFGQVVAGMDVVDRIARGDTIHRVRVWDGTRWTEAAGAPAAR
jgi:cyclophilin family peptidyl-prolyl cis-trans isomerase/HEAT repeat protein